MLDGPLYSGLFGSCFVVGRGGLSSCLVIIVFSLDVENVVGNVAIYVVRNTIDLHCPFTTFYHKIFVTVYNILELHAKTQSHLFFTNSSVS